MNGLRDFLAPFSHLLFANRNIVIVLLCAVVFWVAIQALLDRWRADRLERDLSKAQSGAGSGTGRRYAASQAEESADAGQGALPPVKGGRTYARNLGSALQKAGMAQPIYSPPTPAGWSPNTSGAQSPQNPAGMGQPYAAPSAPWGAPPQPPPAAPWAFPAGSAGRGLPGGPSPAPVPFYSPQPPVPMMPQQGPPPSAPAPGMYGPSSPPPGPYTPSAQAPFGPSPFQPGNSGQSSTPAFGPPAQPGPFMAPPPPPTMAEPTPEGGRRGKPKRRRFNFNVLENLEKMVQPKAAEPLPTTSWTPPAAAPPATPTTPPSFSPNLPATPAVQSVPTPVEVGAKSPTEEPSLPLPFGDRSEIPAKAAEAEPATVEPPLDDSADPGPSDAFASVPDQGPAGFETEHPRARDSRRDATGSMRSMMFGEEMTASEAQAEETTPERTESTQEPANADSPWPSYSWQPTEEATGSVEAEPVGGEATAASTADGVEVEPVAESSGTSYDDWKSSHPSETEDEATSEPEAAVADEPANFVPAPFEPVTTEGDRPSAGTMVIIEDDATAASYYATLFRGNGYQVEVANDGVSGVDLCTRVQPQVILLDVMMPRQNGILVLQTLRASDETKNTPVVVMSNFSEPTLIKRALQLGALEYVIKTQVEGPALLNAVPRWMNREKAFAAA
jgi:CheY-like chemotaxis protein